MSFFDKLTGKINVAKEEKPKAHKKATKKDKIEKVKIVEEKPPAESEKTKMAKAEPQPEGQLAIDVYETANDFVIQSTIAGLKAEDLDISVEDDLVTIKGERQKSTEVKDKNFLYQECYWGSFSRQVILPEEVDGSKAEATMKDGVLTLTIPKLHKKEKKKIVVKQEE